MKVDFTNVEKKSYDPIPAGKYVLIVSDGEQTETKNEGKLPKGTPGIRWEFTVDGGQNDGRKLWTNTWIHPNTNGILLALLDATGKFNEAQLSGDLDFDIEDVVGSKIGARVKERPGNEQYDASNDISRFLKVDDVAEAEATSQLP